MEQLLFRKAKFLDSGVARIIGLLTNAPKGSIGHEKLCEIVISAFMSELEMRDHELLAKDQSLKTRSHETREIKRELSGILKSQSDQQTTIKKLNQALSKAQRECTHNKPHGHTHTQGNSSQEHSRRDAGDYSKRFSHHKGTDPKNSNPSSQNIFAQGQCPNCELSKNSNFNSKKTNFYVNNIIQSSAQKNQKIFSVEFNNCLNLFNGDPSDPNTFANGSNYTKDQIEKLFGQLKDNDGQIKELKGKLISCEMGYENTRQVLETYRNKYAILRKMITKDKKTYQDYCNLGIANNLYTPN
jgi:hypothetical protein